MLDFIAEAKVLIMQREDLWMIIDEIYKLALLFTCHINCSPHIQFKRQVINLPGNQISGVADSTYSDLTLMELCATAEKDIWMLSLCLSMLALCSISSICSALNNSVANKGCQIHTFCLVVLTRMTGTLLAFVVATHLLIIIPRGRL